MCTFPLHHSGVGSPRTLRHIEVEVSRLQTLALVVDSQRLGLDSSGIVALVLAHTAAFDPGRTAAFDLDRTAPIDTWRIVVTHSGCIVAAGQTAGRTVVVHMRTAAQNNTCRPDRHALDSTSFSVACEERHAYRTLDNRSNSAVEFCDL